MTESSALDAKRLRAVLGVLLPGDDPWPSATALELERAVLARLAALPEVAAAIGTVLSTLADDAIANGGADLEDALGAVERDNEEAFAALVFAAYASYYSDARVRRVMEDVTGYEARPPQPAGYELPPFDEALLETMRKREPFWRRV